MTIMITMPFQSIWSNIALVGGLFVLSTEIYYHGYRYFYGSKKKVEPKPKPAVKKFKMPAWAVTKINNGELIPSTLTEEQLAALNSRKPAEIWNDVLIFPDILSSKRSNQRANMTINKLIRYFEEARTSIYLCVYLNSNHDLTDVILKKHREGLLVHVVTDYDTWTAHNNSGTKLWKKHGIEVRMKDTGYLMHNKFAIIDDEAVLTGSLNWTRQGVQSNNENVLVTTDQRIVSKYIQEFWKLWGQFKPTS
ncbi:Mitochondrial cardiolipin hydrolase [Orchesella cincta]|uniref:Mitochondrial cardiolipin hydrolase n=1 Tax=Orchesella cincta TaxID=48709 RepID=A0A1D2MYC7_ORCCI|nr:Mitochondrial cardiolipin hydrolase [Orchesella cincta]